MGLTGPDTILKVSIKSANMKAHPRKWTKKLIMDMMPYHIAELGSNIDLSVLLSSSFHNISKWYCHRKKHFWGNKTSKPGGLEARCYAPNLRLALPRLNRIRKRRGITHNTGFEARFRLSLVDRGETFTWNPTTLIIHRDTLSNKFR